MVLISPSFRDSACFVFCFKNNIVSTETVGIICVPIHLQPSGQIVDAMASQSNSRVTTGAYRLQQSTSQPTKQNQKSIIIGDTCTVYRI